MQCFWGFEAGVAAIGILRYRHVRRTAHRDLIFDLEEEEDWFASGDASIDPSDAPDDHERVDADRELLDA
jgi:hypothetical protein